MKTVIGSGIDSFWELAARVAGERGHELSRAIDSGELTAAGAEADLVLLHVPGGELRAGPAMCRKIARDSAGKPVVLVALEHADEIEEHLEAGADDCVLPPWTAEALGARISVAERRAALRASTGPPVRDEDSGALFELAPEALLVFRDADESIVASNAAAARLLGRAPGSLVGRRFQEWSARSRSGAIGGDTLEFEAPGGTRCVAAATPAAISWNGEKSTLVCLHDVTERVLVEERLRLQTRHDQLTGVFSRSYFLERLGVAAGAARRHSQMLSLCVCDLDDFKQINDRHGHVTGDAVLGSFGRLIQEQLRAEDLGGRIGGDEFCLAFPFTGATAAAVAVERIRRRFQAEPIRSATGATVYATASFGLSDLRLEMSDEEFIADADAAMYEAKRTGRDQVFVRRAESCSN